MRDDPADFRALTRSHAKEPRFVVHITFPTGSLYVTSHADISSVPGTVLSGCLLEPTITSQKLNPDEARAEIGSASFSLVDVGSQFTTQIKAQLALGAGLRGRRVRFYLGYAGMTFSGFQLIATQDVSEATYDKGVYKISCSDVQRSARKEVFVPFTTTLAATVNPGDTTITVESTDGIEPCWHSAAWTDLPSNSAYYFKIKDTIYSAIGKTATTFTGVVHGVLGSVAGTYTVDASTPASRREKVSEYVFLELPGPKLLYALLTGVLYGDGHNLPANWHLGIDPALVRLADFTGIGPDLWDVADDAKGTRLRFEGIGKIDGKKFYETEILRLLGCFSPVYADGTLGLRRMTRVLADAGTVATLDESNVVSVGALTHEMGSLRNAFTVSWNPAPDGKSFTRSLTLLDAVSRAIHGAGEDLALAFKGLWGGRDTDSTIYRLVDGARDRYAAPPLTLELGVLNTLTWLDPGDVVRVKLAHVRDYAGNVSGIDRAFEVHNASVNHRTGKVSLQVFGSTAPASAISPTTASTALPDAFYTSAGTALSTIVTITAGVAAVGSYTLAGGTDLTAAESIFYVNGDLTIPVGCNLNVTRNVQLRVKGVFTLNGTINGIGGGRAGVADASGPTQPAGSPGFVGNARGWDGIDVARDYEEGPADMATAPAQLTKGANASFPPLVLSVVGSTLSGLPTDLRGTGGGPGGRITAGGVVKALGGTGGNGGAGLCIISRGFGMGAAASINLSGASSAATTVLFPASRNSYAPGPGGAGGPGACLILMDGAILSAPDLTGKFTANTGSITLPSGSLPPNGVLVFLDNNGVHRYPSNTGVWMGYGSPDVISSKSLSVSALRIQYVPAEETPSLDVASKPPPPTGLSVAAQVGAVSVDITVPSFDLFDTVEVWASTTNDRTAASKVADFRGTGWPHPLPGGATRYYWVRTKKGKTTSGADNVSDWFPNTTTTTASATASAPGSGPAGDSLIVQYSDDASTWHDPPWVPATDLYMRQKVGTAGTYSAAIRIVGEDGATGSTGGTGNFVDFVFKRSATAPATPTGSSPSGWSDGPPADDGNPLWMSSAEKTAGGSLVGAWTAPVRLDGAQGLGLYSIVTSGVTRTAARLEKTAGAADTYDAQAYSVEGYSTGCMVSAIPEQTTARIFFGLNSDPATDANYASIDFAWFLDLTGQVGIYESGTSIGNFGAYNATTILAISYDGFFVRYFKDGAEVRRVQASPSKLFFDSSFATLGGALRELAFVPLAPDAVTATKFNTLGVGQKGNSLTRTSATAGWDSQAYSLDSYRTCMASAQPGQTTAQVMFGLNSDPATDSSYASIDFAWYLTETAGLAIYESGTLVQTVGTYATTTALAIVCDGTFVRYLVNGTEVRRVAAPDALLYFDSSFVQQGATLRNVSFVPLSGDTSSGTKFQTTGVGQVGSTLTKTLGTGGWDAQAYSRDAYATAIVSAQALQTDKSITFGLNTDPTTDANYASIDYGWHLQDTGALFVWESAFGFYAFGTYTTSTVLSITCDGTFVRYLKDGVEVKRTPAPAVNLYFDSSFAEVGGALRNVFFGPLGSDLATGLKFQTLGVGQNGTTLFKSYATSGWDSQAYSVEGYGGGCYASARPGQTTAAVGFGLNTDPTTDANYASIDFFFDCDFVGLPELRIYESGAFVGAFGTYTTDTLLAISWDGGRIRYWKDGAIIREVPYAGAKLYFDSSFYSPSASLRDVQFSPLGVVPGGTIQGAALNRDPNFEDAAAWRNSPSTAGVPFPTSRFVTVTDGATGIHAFRTPVAAGDEIYGTDRIPVDPTKFYRVRGRARRSGTGNGTLYLGMVFYDSAGAYIDAVATAGVWGTHWYVAASAVTPATTWGEYVGMIGPGLGTAYQAPANARTMAPMALLNYGGTLGYAELQDVRIEEVVPTTLIAPNAVTISGAVTMAPFTGATGAPGEIAFTPTADATIDATCIFATSMTGSADDGDAARLRLVNVTDSTITYGTRTVTRTSYGAAADAKFTAQLADQFSVTAGKSYRLELVRQVAVSVAFYDVVFLSYVGRKR